MLKDEDINKHETVNMDWWAQVIEQVWEYSMTCVIHICIRWRSVTSVDTVHPHTISRESLASINTSFCISTTKTNSTSHNYVSLGIQREETNIQKEKTDRKYNLRFIYSNLGSLGSEIFNKLSFLVTVEDI